MSTPIAQPMPEWDVNTVTAELDTTNPANPVPGQRITFTLRDTGVQGSVVVPDSRIGDVPYVTSVIAAKARQLHVIAGLTSD